MVWYRLCEQYDCLGNLLKFVWFVGNCMYVLRESKRKYARLWGNSGLFGKKKARMIAHPGRVTITSAFRASRSA